MTNPPAPLRVLSIAHTAVSRAAGRLRYLPLVQDKKLALQLIVPARWHQFGRWIEADPATDPGLDIRAMPIRLAHAGPASWYLHVYPGLARAARQFRPEIIHLWEEPWSLVALHAALLARRHDAALVLEVDQNIMKRLPPPFETIRRQVLRRTHLVLSRSQDATEIVRACGFCGPCLPIGYGVDQSVFHPPATPATRARFRLGYVGRLVVEKGLDDVLDALAQTRAPIELAILGEGPHGAALRARSAALGDRVQFLPWTAPEHVATFLQGLSALVLPTRTTGAVKEQFGRVIIEAQACGTPVIGSRSGAIPDVIGEGGWVVPERDPAALATLLDHVAATPSERHARATAGLANVASRFTYDRIARQLAHGWAEADQVRSRRRRDIRHTAASTEAEPS